MAKNAKAAPQLEVKWDKPEPFALVVQQTTDGDRVTREQAQREADKQHSEKQQQELI